MTVKKLSIALDAKVAARASRSAGRAGMSLSAWLSHAAENALAVEDGLAAVAEWERENGRLTDEELAAAGAVVDRTVPRSKARRRTA